MTDLEIANKALTLLGVQTVDSLNTAVQAARIMNQLLPTTKQAVLADFPWTFALQIAKLTRNTSAALTPGWLFAFSKPSAALHIFAAYIGYSDGHFAERHKVDFKIENNLIFANHDEVWLEYTVNITSGDSWSHMACEALASRLAAEAAVSLTSSPNLVQLWMSNYFGCIEKAKNETMREQTAHFKPTNHYVNARY